MMNAHSALEYNSLSWVKKQLDTVLVETQSRLSEYIDNNSNIEALNDCIQNLKLVYGTLQMVEVYGAAMLAEEMEQTALAALEGRIDNQEDVFDVLMRAMLQLPDYLEGLQAGNKDSAIALMPLINDLRAARKDNLLSESVLLFPDFGGVVDTESDAEAARVEAGKLVTEARRLRTHFQLGMLDVLRNNKQHAGFQRMLAVIVALEKVSAQASVRRFWSVIAALFEALLEKNIDTSISIKMLLGGIDRQIRLLVDEGEASFTEKHSQELLKNILYYIGNSAGAGKRQTRIRTVYKLDELMPEAGADIGAGGLNVELFTTVSQGIKEDMTKVKDSLEIFVHKEQHDVAELVTLLEQLGRIGDTYGMLGLGATRQKVLNQREKLDKIIQGDIEFSEAVVEDIANNLLSSESELNNFIAQRSGYINKSDEHGQIPAAEYREVLDTAISQSLQNLSEARETILAYLAGIGDQAHLEHVLQSLEEVRGVSLMLSLDQIESIVTKLKKYVGVVLVEHNVKPDLEEQDTIADVITSIEYFLEAMSEGRPGVEQGLRTGADAADRLVAVSAALSAGHAIGVTAMPEEPPIMATSEADTESADAQIETAAHEPLHEAELETPVDESEIRIDEVAAEPEQTQDAVTVALESEQYEILSADADEEILEIFIEEALEVLDELHSYLPALKSSFSDENALTTVRRCFHTLKGSGRLVGAQLIGEFSWKFENLLNRILENRVVIDNPIVQLLDEAVVVIPQLVEQLKGNREPVPNIDQLMASADAAAEGRPVPEHASMDNAPIGLVEALVDEQTDADDTGLQAVEIDTVEEAAPNVEDYESGTELDQIRESETYETQAENVDDAVVLEVIEHGDPGLVGDSGSTEASGADEFDDFESIEVTDVDEFDNLESLEAVESDEYGYLGEAQVPNEEVAASIAAEQASTSDEIIELEEPAVSEGDMPVFEAVDMDITDEIFGVDDEMVASAISDAGTDDAQYPDAETQWPDELEPEEIAEQPSLDGVEAVSERADIEIDTATGAFGGFTPTLVEVADASDESVLNNDKALVAAETDEQPVAADGEYVGVLDQDAFGIEVADSVMDDEGQALVHTLNSLDDEENLEEEPFDAHRFDDEIIIEMDEAEPEQTDEAGNAIHMDPELFQIYYAESSGYLKQIRDLLVLHHSQEQPLTANKDLIRAFHTLYGSARTAEIDQIAELCGAMEKYVKVRQEADELTIPGDIIALIENLESKVGSMLEEIRAGDDPAFDRDLLDSINKEVQAELQSQLQRSMAQEFNLTGAVPKVIEESPQEQPEESPVAEAEPVDESAGVLISYSEIDDDLIDIFLEEADELLESCEESLLEIIRKPDDDEHIHQLQRYMHTLKGGARMAELLPVGDLTHLLESLVVRIADGKVRADKIVFDLLNESIDRLASMLKRVKAREPVLTASDLVTQLESLIKGDIPEKRTVERFDINLKDLDSTDEDTSEPDVAADVATAEVSGNVVALREARETDSENYRRRETDEKPHWGERATDVSFKESQEQIRVRADLLNMLVNSAGEITIYHARMGKQMSDIVFNLAELDSTVTRLKEQLRNMEIETEIQIHSTHAKETDQYGEDFDPLEMDRYSTLQQLSRSLTESAGDVESIKDILNEIVRDSETLLMQESRVSSDLQEGLMRTRMVRFGGLATRLRRIVRQTSKELGKEVNLGIIGETNEVDRTVLDRIIAPLEHMLRNAVAHGIENPRARQAAGKPEAGKITITVDREGADVIIRVEDDGAGIDVDKIREKAISTGLLDKNNKLSNHDVLQLILKSGFSTAKNITQVSGRGVGMDVVDAEIKQLGGILEISTRKGKGAVFNVRLPLTLAINQALLVTTVDEVYAVPLASIEGVVRITGTELQQFYNSEHQLYEFNNVQYQLMHLGKILTGNQQDYSRQFRLFPVLLVKVGEQHFALHVDDLVGRREIVVKPVGHQISGVRGIAGATILADGRVVLILEMSALVMGESLFRATDETLDVEPLPRKEKAVTTVMVVDDSITIRKVTARMLERNGMQVLLAKDGVDATNMLQDHMPDLMLLDIEMPRMDGFELASYIRNDDRLKQLPIIMITSRTGSKHKEKAMEIGVNEYLGKPYQEEELMNNINKILQVAG